MVFIHGYGNSFDAAALTTGEICRSLQNQFVCIVLTWPAGGSGGFFLRLQYRPRVERVFSRGS
ncbi:alpha/beta hydrolase (plasmid) [Sinorhizobium meliloti]|nr:alpha/beta hydrolase [Sinorhizobium meliloti]